MMKLKLLTEQNTSAETIEHLVEGMQKTYPASLDISIPKRYALKYNTIWKPPQEHEERLWFSNYDGSKPMRVDAWVIKNITYYNLWPIAQKFIPEKNTGLIILIHSPFIYIGPPKKVGEFGGEFLYASSYRGKERTMVVGGSNRPDNCNVKLACHELGHSVILDCDNYIGDKRCLMNAHWMETPNPNKSLLDELSSDFCESCKLTIKRVDAEVRAHVKG